MADLTLSSVDKRLSALEASTANGSTETALAQLETRNAELNGALEQLTARMAELETRIGTLDADYQKAQDEIAEFRQMTETASGASTLSDDALFSDFVVHVLVTYHREDFDRFKRQREEEKRLADNPKAPANAA